jgi:hypothetical protein
MDLFYPVLGVFVLIGLPVIIVAVGAFIVDHLDHNGR